MVTDLSEKRIWTYLRRENLDSCLKKVSIQTAENVAVQGNVQCYHFITVQGNVKCYYFVTFWSLNSFKLPVVRV